MITIGVTGHRNIHPTNELQQAIDIALEATLENNGNGVVIVSPLAEGADRIVALQVLEKHPCELIVPIPHSLQEYLEDFDTETSKQEFLSLIKAAKKLIELPVHGGKDAGYLAAGQYVLNHSDVLFALWDGKPARGVGGTGQIVELARKQKKPIVWINPTVSPMIPKFENFPLVKMKVN